jgi:hypothetical protein
MKIIFCQDEWREYRLLQLVTILKKYNLTKSILELEDHEGMLTVKWIKEPIITEKAFIDIIWENEFNEPATEHLW